jgi:hypothetical protein
MAPSAVNNSARALEGLVARYFFDNDTSVLATISASLITIVANRNSLTLTGTTSNYVANYMQAFTMGGNPNTGPVRVTVDGVGPISLRDNTGASLTSSVLLAGSRALMVKDGTNNYFRLLYPTVTAAGYSDPLTTRGDVLYRNAANATARLAVGSADYVLTSDGTDAAWAAAGGGGWEFVSVVNASNQATVVFENMASGYDYLYQWEDANPVSDGDDSQMEIGVAGPTYRTSGYLGAYTGINNDTGATYKGTATANWLMTGNEDVGNTTATDFQIGHCHLINPANASFKTGMLGYTAHKSGSSQDYVWYYGRYNTAEANTCWKFEYDAGNVKNGKFMQYRRARS